MKSGDEAVGPPPITLPVVAELGPVTHVTQVMLPDVALTARGDDAVTANVPVFVGTVSVGVDAVFWYRMSALPPPV